MDSKFNIAISGIPNKLSDLPLDTAIMCHELLQNTFQSTGLYSNVQIIRTIGATTFNEAINTSLSNKCQIHLLFSIQYKPETNFDTPLPILSTLQHRAASVYKYFSDRLAFNERPARTYFFPPTHSSSICQGFVRSFSEGCDMCAISLGTYSNQTMLREIHKYATVVARAAAQALYRYVAENQHLAKRQGPQSGPAPYPKPQKIVFPVYGQGVIQ